MSIKWTPWFNVAMHRRLEILSVALIIFVGVGMGPCATLLIGYLLFYGNIYLKAICLAYIAFLYYDRKSGDRGGRGSGSTWLRQLTAWKHIVNYFPMDVVKTADLPPNRNYLLCFFPHALFGLSVSFNMSTSHSKWAKLFPEIRQKCTTLSLNTLFPLSREIFLGCGMCAPSARAITTLLTQSNDPNDESNRDGYTSNGVALVVGGAREATYAVPNKYTIVLKNRKGFIRIALETGSPLVPIFTFNESKIYDIVEFKAGSLTRRVLDFIKKITTVNPVPFNGRGFLQYNFGLIPRRASITTVVGAPIYVEKDPNPSQEKIQEIHNLFCKKLNELFEAHKSKYVDNFENVYLEMI